MSGRFWLWCAWVSPTLLTLSRSETPRLALGLLLAGALAGVLAFLPRFGWKLATLLSVLALPFTLWWCGYASLGGEGADSVAAAAALNTNAEEALGALRQAAARPGFVITACAHGIFLALACRTALRATPVSTARKTGVSGGFLACLLLLAAFLIWPSVSPGPSHLILGTATFSSPLGSAAQLLAEIDRVAHLSTLPRNHRPDVRAATADLRPILAIFYLGESVRSDGYGPQRREAASRQLGERIQAGLGTWLPTTCASSDGTGLSVPLLLTATPPENFDAALVAPTVLGTLKQAGFTTAWFANNDAGELAREGGHDRYEGRFSADPRLPIRTATQGWRYDSDMIPIAQDFAGQHSGAVALILHAVGSHSRYQDRYPEDFFPPEPAGLTRDAALELRYARSLEYGADVMMRTAVALLDASAKPAFLVYTADHGENLPSDGNGLQIHLALRTSTEDGLVPSFVLWNRAMADTDRPQRILARLQAAKMIAHADVARAFLALAGTGASAVEPTPTPRIWGRLQKGEPYGAIPCGSLQP